MSRHGRLRDARSGIARLAAILGDLRDGVLALDADGRCNYVNVAATHLLGERDGGGPVLGAVLLATCPGLRGTLLERELERALEDRRPTAFEALHPPSGRTLDVRLHPTRDGIVAHVADAADRRSAVGDVASDAAAFDLVEAHAHLGHWSLELASGRGYWSNEMFRLLGRDPARGAPAYEEFLKLVHPEDRRDLTAAERQALAEPGSVRVEFRSHPEQEPQRFFIATVSCERDEAGRPTRMTGTLLDATEIKRASHAIERSEAQFRALFEESPDIVLVLDGRDGTIVRANRKVREILGHTPEALVGRKVGAILPPAPRLSERDLLDAIRAQGAVLDGQVLLRADGTECPADLTAALVPWEGRTAILATFRDLTERAIAERVEAGHAAILESVAKGRPLAAVLEQICRVYEAQFPGTMCSVLLVDEGLVVLRHGAGPSLPPDYMRAIDGVAIGPRSGSCGMAAYRGEPVVTADVERDPAWQDHRELPLRHGLRSCWSRPFLASDGRVRGTVAAYTRAARLPGRDEWRALERIADLAAIAVDRRREEEAVATRIRHQSVMLALRQLALQGLPIDALVQKAAAAVAANLQVDGVATLEPLWSESVLRCVAGGAGDLVVGTRLPAGPGTLGHAMLAAGGALLVECESETRFELPPELRGRGILGIVSVPIGLPDRPLGCVAAWGRRRAFGADDVAFLQSLADLLADAFARERAADEANRFFSLSLELLCIIDLDGRFRRVNPSWQSVMGWTAEEMATKTLFELMHPADRVAAREALERVVASGGIATFETLLETRDGGHRSLEWNARIDAERRVIMAAARDVTEQRRTEQQLRQSQKMEAIGRLAGGVAHDFNNVLSVVIGQTELLQRRGEVPAAAQRRLAQIRESADRAAGLTRQLLAFSRKQVLQPRIIDLNQSVRDVEKMLRPMLGEDVELQTALDPTVVQVEVDPTQVVQVILNLAVNARDAMPRGGRLVIRTGNVEFDATACRARPGTLPGRYALLSVEDTGHGMSAEVLAQIFEPFFTTKEEGKGTGLGLATVHGIVQQSGGLIDVASVEGRGATFSVYLPAAQPTEAATVPERHVLPEVEGGSETVLLVEDEETLRPLVQEILEDAGYRVLAAGNAEAALAMAASGTIDLLVTDVIMPGTSGPDLASALRAGRPELRVLYMSGYSDERLGAHNVAGPEVHFVQKPFTSAVFLAKVRAALESGRR